MATDSSRLASALQDRYRLDRELGQGGMATVYLAHDIKHDRKVAIKVLRPELAAVIGAERFLSEIKTTANLQHPHILPLFDSGAADSFLYYVMPFIEGETLRDRLKREKQLPVSDAVRIATQATRALDHAHRHGVIHRDIKPENILLTREGDTLVADFGIALAATSADGNRLTETGLSLGTPQYMSPEQAAGERELDRRSDLYSLGVVLYEMFTGAPPHTGPSAQAVIVRIMTTEPAPLRVARPDLPAHLEAAVLWALAKAPADRPSSASALIEALTTGATENSAALGRRDSRGRGRAWIAVALALVALSAGGLALALRSRAVSPAPPTEAVQVTTSGDAWTPLLAPDGSEVVYATTNCSATGACTWSIMLRETTSDAERPIITGLTDVYPFQWSRDGRYLLFTGDRTDLPYGIYAISRQGGTPVKVSDGAANFLPHGDTVVTTGPLAFNQRTVELYFLPPPWNAISDSVRVETSGGGGVTAIRIPSSGRLMALAWTDALSGTGMVTLHDRSGRRTDTLTADGAKSLRWSPDEQAILLPLPASDPGARAQAALLRIAVDTRRGTFGRRDTLLLAPGVTASAYYDLSADGTALAYSASRVGESTVWAVTSKGRRFTERRLLSSSQSLRALIARDGQSLLYSKRTPVGDSVGTQWFTMPFDSGPNRAITPPLTGVIGADADAERLYLETSGRGSASRLTSYDLAGGRPNLISDALPDYDWLEPGPDGGIVLSAGKGDTLIRMDASGHQLWRTVVPDSDGRVAVLVPSPDHSQYRAFMQPLSLALGGDGKVPVTILGVSAANGQLEVVTRLRLLSFWSPFLWSDDGWLYFSTAELNANQSMLHRVRATGGPEAAFAGLPDGRCTLSGDLRRWVCVRTQSLSDIYLVRHFNLVGKP